METTIKTNQISELRLKAHGVHRIAHYHPGTTIACSKGVLWVTQTGDRRDHILLPGDQFTSRKRGKILIEAMREAAIRIASAKNIQVNHPSRLMQGGSA